ncbi:DUF2852 domain-containing protein [uncultured Jannaschia sp.]|uniref:DUF2852 domain-containing protein n=1 Tax=uncultured Jannaschia sp. TaxID=293347 RepID=UPI002632F97F|nr:DUF2852 domain-containing protein [uncultured Jannaschia sp.]
MTPATANVGRISGNWLAKAEAWLDARGKGAWIALTIVALVVAWPVGLAILAYALWSRRIVGSFRGKQARRMTPTRFRSSGNTAFDAYKADMLRRLEDEQEAFESFLERLREAKDKAEFDQFMQDREKRAASGDAARPSDA